MAFAPWLKYWGLGPHKVGTTVYAQLRVVCSQGTKEQELCTVYIMTYVALTNYNYLIKLNYNYKH